MSTRTEFGLVPSSDRLDSWKEIAVYLNRSVRTVRRWEWRERLPVHRLQHEKRGSVYAYKLELDSWRESRNLTDAALPEAPHQNSTRRLWFVGGAVASLTIIFVLASWPWSKRDQAPHPIIRSIAVLPLEGLAENSDQAYFRDGVTEELIANLSKIGSLRVISYRSIMSYKGGRHDLSEVARKLNVDAILTGSVVRTINRVRISIQLVKIAEQRNLWAETYERDLDDILPLQAEVARTVASQIRTSLTPQQQTRLSTTRQVDAEAHELHLLGKHHANKGTEEGLNRSISYFDRAIARSPDYAKPYGGVAFAYTQLSSFYIPPRVAMPKARAAALKALQLDEELSEAHTWLGMIHLYFDWDWNGAERELRRAMELNPNSAAAHILYQNYLLSLGRNDEALREVARSIELDPLSVHVLAEAQFANLLARQNDQAIALGRRLEEIEPGFGTSHLYTGLAYADKGDFGRAVAELQTAVRVDPNPTNKAYLAYARARAGDKAGAERILTELERISAHQYVCPFEVASAYAGLGRKQEVYRWMRKAVHDRADCMVWLRTEPWLLSLRGDPEYRALTHEIGFR